MSAIARMIEGLRPALEALMLEEGGDARPIHFAYEDDGGATGVLSPVQAAWLAAQAWRAEEGVIALLPDTEGGLSAVVLGLGKQKRPCAPLITGALFARVPKGDYEFAAPPVDPDLAALAWLMGAYAFERYKSRDEDRKQRRLVWPDGADRARVLRMAQGVWLARNLINTPANDLGPDELETAVREVASLYHADVKVTEGLALLADNLPMIHAVGRASDRAPRLIDLNWGTRDAPKVTLVGKGVCFDTGGLNLKLGNSMSLMKKDMGGAATAIAAAAMIMDAGLPVRLRLLIPAVDNSVSGNAFRPGDVLPSRAGLNVEIGNTDAEGRLVLADALALACEEKPDLLISLATLTGSARIALGPDLPALFSDDEEAVSGLMQISAEVADPMWRMPFWGPYDRLLKSKVADLNHIADGTFAGSIVAALFLKRFAKGAKSFAHIDLYAWTPRAQAGKPEGGEPQGARALYTWLERVYSP